ncbi:MAG: S-adenosylmethionine:tRNA ribosyltransferase-isomerase, partial [Bacteroidaceae bacterium]|nr:S-adenosylmethionine:tRNA ribosyltransferase-isomerase [Bacteroidaceae bacterium]
MDTKHIQIRDYNYPLPDERIAKYPLPERDSSKLLVYRGGHISETVFRSLPSLLPKGALMVFNNTRVIQARLHFRKDPPRPSLKGRETAQKVSPLRGNCPLEAEQLGSVSDGGPKGLEGSVGALIEIFLLEPADPVEYQENFAQKGSCSWYCLVGNSKKWKEGKLTRKLTIKNEELRITAERIGTHGTSQEIRFEWTGEALTFAEVLDAIGELPIPPYLNRKSQESDKTTYQTVYSKIKGSVAAPTAGLHFTKRVLADIDARGIEREEVTLHVGAGTFRPVKSEDIGGHDMHTEHIAVHRRTIERLLAHGGEAIAVGTTSVRTLESLYYMGVMVDPSKSPLKGETYCAENPLPLREGRGGSSLHVPQWMPYEYDNSLSTVEALEALLRYMDERGEEVLHASTQIIIAPGYKYHIVRRMITNFHQPQSTLLLLVSAFIGDNWHQVYD